MLLHISYDLRDRYDRPVTIAVKNLIDQSKKITKTLTVDLVRVPKFGDETVELAEPDHLKINNWGLPYGLFLIQSQKRGFKTLLNAIKSNDINLSEVNVIHSHKLTFEGYIGYKLSEYLKVPLIITLRQTDSMVFNNRPDLKKIFAEVLKKCDKVIYLIPNILKVMEGQFGKDFYKEFIEPKIVFIPNIVDREVKTTPGFFEKGKFLTILRMTSKSVKRKNLKNLLAAFELVEKKDVSLEIIGNGPYFNKVKNWINNYNLKDKTNLIGKVDNDKIDEYYSSCQAFVMPSISESFGLVYMEALMNGTPIMYSKDHLGFEGIFEDVGVAVNPRSIESIAEGLQQLLKNNIFYRKKIEELKREGAFEIFSSDNVRSAYQKVLNQVSK